MEPQQFTEEDFRLSPEEQPLRDLYEQFVKGDPARQTERFMLLWELGIDLQQRRPDVAQHCSWHMIVGSSYPQSERPPHLDFEGEDSVEKFIRDQLTEETE